VPGLRPGRPLRGNSVSDSSPSQIVSEIRRAAGGAVVLVHVIADAGEIADGGLRPSDTHRSTSRARIAPVDHRQNIGMFDEFAPVRGGDTFVDFADEPLVVTDESLDGLAKPALRCPCPVLRQFGSAFLRAQGGNEPARNYSSRLQVGQRREWRMPCHQATVSGVTSQAWPRRRRFTSRASRQSGCAAEPHTFSFLQPGGRGADAKVLSSRTTRASIASESVSSSFRAEGSPQ